LGRWGSRSGSGKGAVELALDFAPEAITLYERAATGGWRKFASAQLDDPEFPVIIGLLRTEAESRAGRERPVRLWLPADQILRQTAHIEGGDDAGRLQAAFDEVTSRTGHRPEDVAIAVSPGNRSGESTILVTFTATWREARQYASRWGFVPGPISTRHHVSDFGSEGPEFLLAGARKKAPASRTRRRAWLGMGTAVAAAAAVALYWGATTWQQEPAESEAAVPGVTSIAPALAPDPEQTGAAPATGHEPRADLAPLPGAQTAPAAPQITREATAAPSPESVPTAGDARDRPPPDEPLDLAARTATSRAERLAGASALPEPAHVAEPPLLAALDQVKQAAMISRPLAVATDPIPTTPASLLLPATAPSTPPSAPTRFEGDPVDAWIGPLPQPEQPSVVALVAAAGDSVGMTQPEYVEDAPALVVAAAPQQAPPVTTPEPPAPRPAQPSDSPAAPSLASPPALAATDSGGNAARRSAAPGAMSTPATPHGLLARPAAPAAASNPQQAPETSGAGGEASRPIEGPVPLPRPRPATAESEQPAPAAVVTASDPAVVATASDPASPLAKILPPPRPARLAAAAEPAAPSPIPTAEQPEQDAPSRIVAASPAAPSASPGAAADSATQAEPAPPPDSRLAVLIAPKPPVRPAQPAVARALASPTKALPKIAPTVPGSVRSAATEPGLPLGQTALIGVVHVDGSSKALLRLPDGRYRSVVVGDVIEGWRVSMIGNDAMRISRSGEERTLILVNR